MPSFADAVAEIQEIIADHATSLTAEVQMPGKVKG
jgi:hypothetical protein